MAGTADSQPGSTLPTTFQQDDSQVRDRAAMEFQPRPWQQDSTTARGMVIGERGIKETLGDADERNSSERSRRANGTRERGVGDKAANGAGEDAQIRVGTRAFSRSKGDATRRHSSGRCDVIFRGGVELNIAAEEREKEQRCKNRYGQSRAILPSLPSRFACHCVAFSFFSLSRYLFARHLLSPVSLMLVVYCLLALLPYLPGCSV